MRLRVESKGNSTKGSYSSSIGSLRGPKRGPPILIEIVVAVRL